MDCVFLLIAHWTTGRGNEVMAPSYGLLDRTVYGRQEFAWSAVAPSAGALGEGCGSSGSEAARAAAMGGRRAVLTRPEIAGGVGGG
jgi:hypothetical protein